MERNIYVFRVNYDDPEANSFIIQEIYNGRLRQGWGISHSGKSRQFHRE